MRGTAALVRRGPWAPPLPSPLPRLELLRAPCTFQGLTVETSQFGVLPWFEPAIGWLDLLDDRLAVYAVKRAAGDTLINIALTGQYSEPGQAYANIPGRDYSEDLPALRALIVEALTVGGMRGVLLMLGGDGNNPDPVGMTKGRTWLMQNFQRIYDALADLSPYIIWCPGYDGVVPAWGPAVYAYPSVVDEWLLFARSVVGPSGYLALELAAGYAHWGGEGRNYTTAAGQALDVVISELPYPMGPPALYDPANATPWNQVWQIVGRLQRPYYRSADQPADDDPNPPYYLAGGTPRGLFVYWAWEFDTYGWVRWLPVYIVDEHRQALRALGCAQVG